MKVWPPSSLRKTPMADMGIVLEDGEKVAEANRRIAAASASRSQRCPKSCTTTERSTDGGKTWGLRTDVSLSSLGANNVFPAIVPQGNGDVRIAWNG